ncbi:peptidase M14, partial [Nitrospirales bacterium NOB]|nr:peptidase M14 [Nitrospirales bacterium NOB]
MAFARLLKGKDPARTPNTLARHLFSSYEQYRLDHLGPHNCNHTEITAAVHSVVASSRGLLDFQEAGKSLEGRSINLISCGKGNKRILLWSQMHGDEYTATLALMDILNMLVRRSSEEKWIHEMFDEATLYFLPMLNPDGAERRQRRTAQNIDMNRDARALITPEAQLLRNLQHRLKPQFGFNLHDQELWAVGDTKEISAVALLAPALDHKRSSPMVRVRAMRVAA